MASPLASGAADGQQQLSWRPLRLSDAASLADLLNTAEPVDGGEEYYGTDDAAEELSDPNVDLARASIAAFDGDLLVGYLTAAVKPLATVEHRVMLEGTVRPDYRRRGIGTRLLREGVGLARAAHERVHPDLPLIIDAQRADTVADAEALYKAQGFTPVRFYQHMRHPLGAAIKDVAIPQGLVLENWSPANDADFHLIRNESFRDHWGSAPVTDEQWKARYANRHMRPDVSFLLRDEAGGGPAGMLLTLSWDADVEFTGMRDAYIMVIGTLAPYRRRGVAAALISRALRAAERHGYDRASLSVDGANPTGAFGVYENAGFVAHQRRTRWSLQG
ncbi:MAG: GNAT family N-acetyltransferase [Catenulispora sp.]|nr:GNAT family N-acetyltransferase [Catenulispora sp.]